MTTPPAHPSAHPTRLRRSASSSIHTSAARTSPRLDATAAFFAGVPSHAVAAMTSCTTTDQDGGDQRRFLLTASQQGELVHWVSQQQQDAHSSQ